MAHLDRNGVLCDYGIREVMAFDEAPARPRVLTVSVDEALKIAEQQRKAADQSPLAKLIPGYNRLP